MSKKPTYEELEQRVRKLEKEASERKLLEDELILKRIVFEMSIAANSTTDNEGVINYVNPTFLKMWGYETKEEAAGNPVPYFFQNADDAIPVLEALEKSGFWRGEFKAKRKDGSIFISRGLASVVRDEAGHQIGYYSANIDVTEHKQAEEKLRASERDLAEAQAIAHIGSWRWEVIPDEVYWSDETYRLFGWEPGEKVNYERYIDAVLPEDRDCVTKGVKDALDGIKPYENEHRIVCNGEVRIHHIRGQVWRDENGKPLRMVGVVQDITERKRAEDQIRRQTDFLERTINSLNHPFYVIDPGDYRVKMTNDAALGTRTFPKNITCYELMHKSEEPCNGSGHVCPIKEVKKTNEPVTVEHIHHDNEGNHRNVEVRAHPVFDNHGNISEIIEYCLDVTERKQAEVAVQERQGELEAQALKLREVNAALEVLLIKRQENEVLIKENISFHVKQLVRPYLERLKKGRLDSSQKALVEILESNMNNIVSQFAGTLSSKFRDLTPMEIRVANVIKEGKTNNEIAEMLCLSHHTILFHRANVRKKLGLRNKRVNLKSYLMTLPK